MNKLVNGYKEHRSISLGTNLIYSLCWSMRIYDVLQNRCGFLTVVQWKGAVFNHSNKPCAQQTYHSMGSSRVYLARDELWEALSSSILVPK